MTIAALPSAPLPTDNTATFNTKAFALVAALNAFVTEANATGAAADADAASAFASAIAAGLSEDAAIAAANFKGAWSTLSGALAIPASVSHLSKVWLLTESVADVTAEVPSVSAKWLAASVNFASPDPIGSTTPAAGAFTTLSMNGGALSPQTGFRNRIINGGMTIDQRNAGASVTPTTSGDWYAADRWAYSLTQSSKFSSQQSATAQTGFFNSILITSLSAYSVAAGDVFAMTQHIEGLNVADLSWGTANAQTVTLSFQVRSSLTGTFGGALQNSARNRSYPFTYTINAANTWETKTVSIAGDTSGTWLNTNGIGITVRLGIGVGSTYSGTAGAWAGSDFRSATGATSVVGTSGATFYITGVQLEKGSTDTSFDFRSYGTELALSERYYQIVVGAVADNGAAADTKFYYVPLNFKTAMRAAPTATFTPALSSNVGSRAVEAQTVNGGRYVVVANGGGTMQDTSYVALNSEL